MSEVNGITSADRSAIFSRYNRLRHQMEPGRANRALGLVQTGEERPYRTTLQYCSCPDFAFRRQKCKHIAALELQQAADQAEEEQGGQETVDDINDLLGFGGW